MSGRHNRVRIKIDPSDLALEIISIVVAILLALGVNYFAGQVKTHDDVRRALAALSAEMESNENAIARIHARHLSKCGVLQTLARRGRGHKLSYTAYQNALDVVLPFAPPPLESTAWDLAQTSGVSANLAYATRAAIARVYAQQEGFGRLANELATDSGRSSSRATSTFSWWRATPHSTAPTLRLVRIA
ncbi:MAG: hypothetical protein IAI50_16565 [Candidatus Eremiobacteraeota bacterium]|nr:hypothetical protein [Candidatus Eremiobacteraeota bacterium]